MCRFLVTEQKKVTYDGYNKQITVLSIIHTTEIH